MLKYILIHLASLPCRAPQYNLISCALKFTEEEGAKQASKATKIKNDLKRQAADYSKKMDEVVLGQEKELDTLWQKYAKQSLDDDRERKVLLQALAQNYASIEVSLLHVHCLRLTTFRLQKVIVALHESAINFEKQRHDTNTKMLTRAQEEVNGKASLSSSMSPFRRRPRRSSRLCSPKVCFHLS